MSAELEPLTNGSSSGKTTATVFPATLGYREKLSTLIVGYGVGIGIPLLLGIIFSTTFHHTAALLFPAVFACILLLCYLLHPRGFALAPDGITIMRHLWPGRMALDRLVSVLYPAPSPTGLTIGLLRIVGIYGTFGIFWNRNWGLFRMFVTDQSKRVELLLGDGSRVIVSPADPAGFVEAVRAAADRAGVRMTTRIS